MSYPMLKDCKTGDVRHKILSFENAEIKAADGRDPDVAGEIKGFAAGTLNIDRGQDIIFPGAFDEDLEDFKQNGVVAYQHDYTAIIGKPVKAEERGDPDYGLYTEAEIVSTSLGSDVMKLVKRQILKTLSIGYRLKEGGYSILNRETLLATLRERAIKQSKIDEILGDFDRRKLTEVFGLFKIKLFEYSVVTLPMNPNAVITGAKGENISGLLDGLPFSYHPLMVLAAVKEYAERLQAQVKTYGEKGRGVSETHKTGVTDIRKALEDLLPILKESENLAKSEMASPEDIDRVLSQSLFIEAQLNGVKI